MQLTTFYTYSALNGLYIFCLMYMHLIHCLKKISLFNKNHFSSNLSQSGSVLEHCFSELVKVKVYHWLTIFPCLCPPWLCSLFPKQCAYVFFEGLLLLYSAYQDLNTLFSLFVHFWKWDIVSFSFLSTGMAAVNQK